MAKRLAKFTKAWDLLYPVTEVKSPLILDNQTLVDDTVEGFDILYHEYEKRADNPLPRSSFLYHLGGAFSADATPLMLAGLVEALAENSELERVDTSDPDIAKTIINSLGAIVYIRKISGRLAQHAFDNLKEMYRSYGKKFDALPTTYQKLNMVKYQAAVDFLNNLYDLYLDNWEAAKSGPRKPQKRMPAVAAPLTKDQFLISIAVLTYFAPLTKADPGALQSVIEYLARSQPKKDLRKQLNENTIANILNTTYGFDLPTNEELFKR